MLANLAVLVACLAVLVIFLLIVVGRFALHWLALKAFGRADSW